MANVATTTVETSFESSIVRRGVDLGSRPYWRRLIGTGKKPKIGGGDGNPTKKTTMSAANAVTPGLVVGLGR